jgi:deazaflavin-dependent oxidoreductase (nitroreductase family)
VLEHGEELYRLKVRSKEEIMSTDLQAFADEDFCYLTTKGRVSGRLHTIEIWYVLNGPTLYMLSGGLDKADWVKNILRQAEVTVKIKDRLFTGQGRVVKDGEEDTLARQLIAEKYPSTDEEDLTEWYRDALPVAVELII